jgi:hypothetical protein
MGTMQPVAIRVFTPIARKAPSFLPLTIGMFLLGAGLLAALIYYLMIGLRAQGWSALTLLAGLPLLWFIIGIPLDVLLQVVRTGGTTDYLRINPYGVLALSGSPTGGVRCIDDPRLDEHADRIILKTSNMGPIVLYRAHTTPDDIQLLRSCVAKYVATTAAQGPVSTRELG